MFGGKINAPLRVLRGFIWFLSGCALPYSSIKTPSGALGVRFGAFCEYQSNRLCLIQVAGLVKVLIR